MGNVSNVDLLDLLPVWLRTKDGKMVDPLLLPCPHSGLKVFTTHTLKAVPTSIMQVT